MHFIDPSEVIEMNIVIHALGGSGVAYGKPYGVSNPKVSPDDQVFVPQGVASKFNMLPGDVFMCRVVPNNPEIRDRIQWRSIYIVPPVNYVQPPRPTTSIFPPTPPAPPRKTDDQIKVEIEQTATDGRVWTTREVFCMIFKKEADHKDREEHRLYSLVGNHLRTLQREGKLCSAEMYGKTDSATAVYFATTMDALLPEGY